MMGTPVYKCANTEMRAEERQREREKATKLNWHALCVCVCLPFNHIVSSYHVAMATITQNITERHSTEITLFIRLLKRKQWHFVCKFEK